MGAKGATNVFAAAITALNYCWRFSAYMYVSHSKSRMSSDGLFLLSLCLSVCMVLLQLQSHPYVMTLPLNSQN